MIKNHKYYVQKEMLRWNRTVNETLTKIRKTPLVEVEEPYHLGWYIHLYSDDPYLEEAIRASVGKFVEYDPKKISKVRKCKNFEELRLLYTERNKHRILTYHGPYINKLYKKRFNELSDQAKLHFHGVYKVGNYINGLGKDSYNIETKSIQIKILKRMVKAIPFTPPDLQSQLTYAEKRMKSNPFYLKGCNSYNNRYEKTYKHSRKNNKDQLKKEINENCKEG